MDSAIEDANIGRGVVLVIAYCLGMGMLFVLVLWFCDAFVADATLPI